MTGVEWPTEQVMMMARMAETAVGRGLVLSAAAAIIDLRHTEGTTGLRQALRRFSHAWLDLAPADGQLPAPAVLVERIRAGLGLDEDDDAPGLASTVYVLCDLHRGQETGFCAWSFGRAAVLVAAAVVVDDHHRLRIRSGMGSSPFTIPDRLRQLAQEEHEQYRRML